MTTALAAALEAYDAAVEADRNNTVGAESELFAEALASGWPGLGADHVAWSRAQVVEAALAVAVDFSALSYRNVQWLAYETDHRLAEAAYDYLDSRPYPAADTPLIITAPPAGLVVRVVA